MTDDLRHVRAPRRHLRRVLVFLLVLAILTVMGPMQLATEIDMEADQKLARVATENRRTLAERPTFIARTPKDLIERGCRKEGRQFVLFQQDGQPWWGVCLDLDFTKERRR